MGTPCKGAARSVARQSCGESYIRRILLKASTAIVSHRNSWFDGLMLMNSPVNYPLQTYLRSVVIDLDTMLMVARDNPQILGFVNERTSRSAQMFISMIPVFLVYPFIQKYFTTGLVMGSVKG